MGKKALSYTERDSLVREAFYHLVMPATDSELNGDEFWYAMAVYEDHLIAKHETPQARQHWRIAYTLNAGAVEIASRETWAQVEKEWLPVETSEPLVINGGEIKALGQGRYGGYLVLFSNDSSPDLEGDFFDANTDFGFEKSTTVPVLYHHGLDKTLGTRKLADGTLEKREAGLWLEFQLKMRDAYEQMLAEGMNAQKFGLSSGANPKAVAREWTGKAWRIKRWGIDEGSITPTPAEPRISVRPLKSIENTTPLEALRAEASQDVPSAAAARPSIIVSPVAEETPTMSAENQTMAAEMQAMKTQMDNIAGILKRFESEPALANSGIVTQDGGTADKNIKSFPDYLLAIKRGDEKRLQEVYGVTKALNEDSGTAGGYTVPAEYRPELLQISEKDDPFYQLATKLPMGARSIEIPVLDQTVTPSAGASSAMFAGVSVSWTEEAGASTETDPKFRMLQLIAYKLTAHTKASSELLADNAVGLEGLLKRLFGGAIAWSRNYAMLRGNGMGKPLGCVGAQNPAAISVTRTGGGNAFELADAKGMKKRLLRQSTSARWWMHPFIESDLIDLALSGNTLVTYMPSLRDAPPLSLFGIPIVFSDIMAAPGSAGDVALVDPAYYVIGERDREMRISMSEHASFTNGQIVWRVEHRIAGAPWMKAPLTLADATNTVSPFVYLN